MCVCVCVSVCVCVLCVSAFATPFFPPPLSPLHSFLPLSRPCNLTYFPLLLQDTGWRQADIPGADGADSDAAGELVSSPSHNQTNTRTLSAHNVLSNPEIGTPN